MLIKIWLEKNSSPIIHTNGTAYEKGKFYCVYHSDTGVVYKYPLSNIWRIEEEYPKELRRED